VLGDDTVDAVGLRRGQAQGQRLLVTLVGVVGLGPVHRELEQVLAEVRQLLVRMRAIEHDHVGERADGDVVAGVEVAGEILDEVGQQQSPDRPVRRQRR